MKRFVLYLTVLCVFGWLASFAMSASLIGDNVTAGLRLTSFGNFVFEETFVVGNGRDLVVNRNFGVWGMDIFIDIESDTIEFGFDNFFGPSNAFIGSFRFSDLDFSPPGNITEVTPINEDIPLAVPISNTSNSVQFDFGTTFVPGNFSNKYRINTFSTTPTTIIEALIDDVQSLVNSGSLNKGRGKSLTVKLEAAKKQLDKGKDKTAVNQLKAFINHVNAFVNAGILSTADRQ